MIVPGEILRGARVAARMSRDALAKDSKVNAWSIGVMERDGTASVGTLKAIQASLEKAGIVFLQAVDDVRGPGLRLPLLEASGPGLLVRAAAAARGYGVEKLASRAAVSERTVNRLMGTGAREAKSLRRMREALEAAGVTFLAEEEGVGPGFRLPVALISRADLRF